MSAIYNELLYLSDRPIVFPPVTRTTPVFYDETNQEIFAIAGDNVTVFSATDRSDHVIKIDNAVNIISIKYSIDHRLLAVQRTNQSVDFLNLQEKTEFTQQCRRGGGSIIGFNWTCQNEIVFITHQGIDFYQIHGKQGKVKHLKTYSVNVNWFVYSPLFCVLVVSSTISGNILHPFHFRAPQHGTSSLTKLPKFQVDIGGGGQLLERQVSIITLHGRLFLAITKSPRPGEEKFKMTEIGLYTLNNDQPATKVAILQLGATGRFALNCVDNMIVVHHQNSKTSLIFDICWSPAITTDSSNTLPLSVTRTPTLKIPNFNLKNEGASPGSVTLFRPILQPMSIKPYQYEGRQCELYSSNWVVFQPGIIIDAKLGILWDLRLSVTKLAMHMVCSKPNLIKLLLHRRNYKSSIFPVIRSLVMTQSAPLSVVGDMFDILNSVIDDVLVTQEEMKTEVFVHVLNKDELPPNYKISLLLEYIRSLRVHKLRIHFFFYETLIQLLLRCGQLYRLHQLLQFQVLGDSVPLACLLLSLDSTYEPAFQLGIDMMSRLSDCTGIIDALLRKGHVTPALRCVLASGQEDKCEAGKFLRVAADSGDNVVFYNTYKFFEGRLAGCEGSEEYVAIYKGLFKEL